MKVFATGASGVIGRYLPESVSPLSYSRFLGDWPAGINPELQGATVIHLAGIVGERAVRTDEKEARWVNVLSLPGFVQWCAASGVERIVYVSSGHVYGGNHCIPIPETTPVSPVNRYGELKAEAEGVIELQASRLGLPFGILRPFSILGQDMPPFSLYGAIQRAAQGGEMLAFSEDVRDFADPRDLAGAIHQAATSTGLFDQKIVNICTGNQTSVRQAAEALSKTWGADVHALKFDGNTSTFPYLVGDPTRMLSALGSGTNLRPEWLR